MQYLVKWVRYPLHDATWEPVQNLSNAPERIKEFELTRTSDLKEGRECNNLQYDDDTRCKDNIINVTSYCLCHS